MVFYQLVIAFVIVDTYTIETCVNFDARGGCARYTSPAMSRNTYPISRFALSNGASHRIQYALDLCT